MWESDDIENEKFQHDEQYSLSWLFKQQRLLALEGPLEISNVQLNVIAPIPHSSHQSQGSPLRRQDLYPSVVGSDRGRSMTGRHTQIGIGSWAERTETRSNHRQKGIT